MANQEGRLAGKVALVTGAASNPGIGFSIAKAYAREGARLIITDVDEEGLEAARAHLERSGAEVRAQVQDVTSEEGWTDLLGEIEGAFGQLDVLVNNAGIAILKPMTDLTMADWTRLVDVNLTSVFLGCKYGADLMRKSGGGNIVNLSSVAGLAGAATTAAYAATKGGVLAMSRSIAVEEAANNIRCNTIHPGMIWTNMQAAATGMKNKDDFKVPGFMIPMERQGTAEEIAAAAVFLGSDEASYVTGTQMVVDGGMTARQ